MELDSRMGGLSATNRQFSFAGSILLLRSGKKKEDMVFVLSSQRYLLVLELARVPPWLPLELPQPRSGPTRSAGQGWPYSCDR